jgi:hypothetical protein
MSRRQRLAARLLTWGLLVAGVCLIMANVDSLVGDGLAAFLIRLISGVVLVFEGLALTLDGSRVWAPPGRRLIRLYIVDRFGAADLTMTGKLMMGTFTMILTPTLFILGLAFVGFGVLQLTRVP